MRGLIAAILVLFIAKSSYAQGIRKAERFLGTWNYQHDLGTETWRMENDVLIGEAFRKNRLGDSTKVEDLRIRKTGKLTVHEWVTYNVVNDSLVTNSATFIGRSNDLTFFNVDAPTPYSISYAFGFLSKKKLIIKIKFGVKEKAVKYKLTRIGA